MSCAKAPYHFQEHTTIIMAQPPFWVTLRSVHYKGRTTKTTQFKGLRKSDMCPHALVKGLTLETPNILVR